MKKILAMTAIIGAISTTAMAAPDDDILARQAAMKAVGAAAKAGDFAAMNKAAMQAQELFKVDTSGQGTVPTEARPEIWTDMAAFDAIMNDLVTKSAAADKSVFGSCKACHADYRIKN
jgi:cytochrome c556